MENKLAAPRFLLLLGISLAILGGIIPLLLAALALGGTPTLQAAQALDLLEKSGETAALVDVRPAAEFSERHVQGAYNLPLAALFKVSQPADLLAALQGKTLVLICEAGFDSAAAARRLDRLGLPVFSVRGGLQEWGRDGPRLADPRVEPSADNPYALIVDAAGRASRPYQALSLPAQAAAAAGLLLIKPTYMLLSLLLMLPLLRSKALELKLAGWGVLLFWLGEVACAVHYTVLKDDSYLAEYLHSYGMVLAFGLITYALFEAIDHRVLHFSDPKKRCAFVDLCGLCIKNPAAGLSVTDCGVYRMAVLLLPLGMLLALIPLGAPLSLYAANVHVGPLVHFYIRTAIQQLFEVRYAPLAAILLFGLAWTVLLFARQSALHPLVRLLTSGAAGFLGFSYFRTGLGLIYENNLALATFWEEATELIFILAALYILWVFRRGLLPGFRLPD